MNEREKKREHEKSINYILFTIKIFYFFSLLLMFSIVLS